MSKILKVGIASLALALVSTAASAESFTFSGSGKSGDQVMVMADGHVSGGGYATNTSEAVMASGKKLASKGACEQWTTDPGSIFSSQGVCTAEDFDRHLFGGILLPGRCEEHDGRLLGTVYRRHRRICQEDGHGFVAQRFGHGPQILHVRRHGSVELKI